MAAPTTDSAMYRTMHRQPADLGRILETGWDGAGQAAERLAASKRIFVTGIGTSYHAALVGEWLLRAAGADARAVMSFDAVVVMAHTGVKRFSGEAITLAAAAGVRVVSVGSLTAEHPGSELVLRTVEREKSAAFTASHLAAMTVLAQVATELGERRKAPGVREFRAALGRLPQQVAGVLAREDEVLPVALEQFLHGPIVSVNAADVAVLVNVPGAAAARVGEIAGVLAAIGARLWFVGHGAPAAPQSTVFSLPEVPELLSPLLTVVPIQILAYHLAVLRGIDPDRFRRDDPTYAAAFGLLKL
jgi:glucosamine--fructose-6-phosphate aminotransferase (isomerizing)